MGEPLYSKEQWSDDLFVRDTAAETAAGERFVDFMLNTHGRTRGAKPPPSTQYEPLRRTFMSDPNFNTGLKTAGVESHWNLEAENARHWAIAAGGTFGRSKRFPKGDTLIDQRKLHKPAQRFYNVDKGRSLGKRARPRARVAALRDQVRVRGSRRRASSASERGPRRPRGTPHRRVGAARGVRRRAGLGDVPLALRAHAREARRLRHGRRREHGRADQGRRSGRGSRSRGRRPARGPRRRRTARSRRSTGSSRRRASSSRRPTA